MFYFCKENWIVVTTDILSIFSVLLRSHFNEFFLGLLLIMIVSLISFVFGNDWWHRSLIISAPQEILRFIEYVLHIKLFGKIYYHEIIVYVTLLSVVVTISYQIYRVFIRLQSSQERIASTFFIEFGIESRNGPFMSRSGSILEIIISLSPFICYTVSIYYWSLFYPNSLWNFPIICIITVGIVFVDMATHMMICHMCKIKPNPLKVLFVSPTVFFIMYVWYNWQSTSQEAFALYTYCLFGIIFMSLKYYTTCKDMAHILGIYIFRTSPHKKVLSKDGVRCLQVFQYQARYDEHWYYTSLSQLLLKSISTFSLTVFYRAGAERSRKDDHRPASDDTNKVSAVNFQISG